MPSLDTEYFRQRAAAERELASQSERANVAAIHDELARQYEALVNRAELRPTLRIAFPPNVESSSGTTTATAVRIDPITALQNQAT